MWLEIPNINLVKKNYKSLRAVNPYEVQLNACISFLGLFEEVFKIQKDLITPNQA